MNKKKKYICKYCGKKLKGPAYRFIMNEETKKLEPAHPECHDAFVRGDMIFRPDMQNQKAMYDFWIKKI